MAKTSAKPKTRIKAKSPAKPAAAGAGAAFLHSYEREHPITVRQLQAYPADKLDLRPHPKCKTARELAWMFVMEQGATETALTKGFDMSKPMQTPPAPATMGEIIAAFDAGQRRVADLVRGMSDAELSKTSKFLVAPRTIGDVPRIQLAWLFLCDQIHHRGQFSIYLRLAEGKVPSIYGPTADEPWF
jgi:uncharacterized damage-inducible protein DinB